MMTSMFRKTLLDLVKGLRSNKEDESAFINQCLSEIKEEVKDKDHDIKANAVQKLCYLYMIGYDISFAHFNVVEVMSQPSFTHKRIGYLASSLSFTENTDVVLLTTHQFKKAFGQSSAGNDIQLLEGLPYEAGCALNCLANICTPYLAETLLEDVYGMMNSSKPYIRKKAVLVLYPIFRRFPRALRLSFDRLKEKLKDEDTGVQNAAVNVVCELARKNPSNYLALLPQLFELLNHSNNNWMLIKLVKLLGSLIPAEPRLSKKLQEPLAHIITNTPAKSLLYECINTATNCDPMPKAMVRLCLEKLRTFVEDPDQNLKYLGLLGLNKIMRHNPRAVAESRDLILQCLDDPDVTIRMRALDLIMSMVTEKNLEAIIQRLTEHLYGTDGSYRDHVLEQIIKVCSKEDYEYVRDFAWYVQLLTNMTHLQSMSRRNAELIAEQMIDVTLRVPEVREFSAQQMETLILNNGLIGDAHNMQSNAICRVLRAAAYIVGEFADLVQKHLALVKAMLQPRISSLPGDIQGLFVHNALKVLASGLHDTVMDEENNSTDSDKSAKLKDFVASAFQLLEPLASSQYIEVQERATAYIYFLKWLGPILETASKNDQRDITAVFVQVFSSELMPVHAKNQAVAAKKIPTGLSLEDWIGEPWPESEKEDDDMENVSDADPDDWFPTEPKKKSKEEKEELKEMRERRKRQKQNDPFMLQEDGQDNNDNKDEPEEENKTTSEESGKNAKADATNRETQIFPKLSSRKQKKKYSVRKGPKIAKDKVEENTESQLPQILKDPLAEKIDWDKPVEQGMSHLQPYRQNDSNLKSVRDALEKKYMDDSKTSEPTKQLKNTKKVKAKGKKKKGSKKATSDETQEEEPKKNKTSKGKKKKASENGTVVEESNTKANTAPSDQDIFGDLFGNLSSTSAVKETTDTTEAQTNGITKNSKKQSKKQREKPKKEKSKKNETEVVSNDTNDVYDPLALFDATDNEKSKETSSKKSKKQKSTSEDKSEAKKSKSKKEPKQRKKEKGKTEK